MRRTLTLAAIAGALLAATLAPAHAEPGWRLAECRYQFHDGRPGWAAYETKATIRCASERFGVSTSTALYVAWRESHYGQYATNPYSSACGVMQHIPSYFPGRLANVPDSLKPWGSSCYNARSNVLAGLWLARNVGWGPWGL